MVCPRRSRDQTLAHSSIRLNPWLIHARSSESNQQPVRIIPHAKNKPFVFFSNSSFPSRFEMIHRHPMRFSKERTIKKYLRALRWLMFYAVVFLDGNIDPSHLNDSDTCFRCSQSISQWNQSARYPRTVSRSTDCVGMKDAQRCYASLNFIFLQARALGQEQRKAGRTK